MVSSLDPKHLILATKLAESRDGDIIPVKFHFDQIYYQLPLSSGECLVDALTKFNVDNVSIWHLGVELDQTVNLGQLSCASYPALGNYIFIKQNENYSKDLSWTFGTGSKRFKFDGTEND